MLAGPKDGLPASVDAGLQPPDARDGAPGAVVQRAQRGRIGAGRAQVQAAPCHDAGPQVRLDDARAERARPLEATAGQLLDGIAGLAVGLLRGR
eukprot:14342602-Alexandrium_andersonii.AAC.1